MSNNNDKDKSKAGLQFSPSTKINEPNVDSLMTSSTAKNNKSTLHKRSNSDSVVPRDANKLYEDVADKIGIVFHGDRRKDTNNNNNNTADYKFKCACVYWRHGFSLPENGRLYLTSATLSFKGIVGTKLSFHLNEINLTITSRMGGLVQDAFAITKVVGGSNNGDSDNNNNKFLFSTVLKDRKKVIDKVQLAIANAKLQREEDEFDAISGPKKKKEKKFRMPPDATLGKMSIIGQKKLKGVSLQDYYEVAWSEGHECEKKPMYGPFLDKQEKNNVSVGMWEAGNFEGEWCSEQYTQKRIVTFDFLKQTIGKTLVKVKHTQQSRRLNNDQCIVQIKMEMAGFPYADCFVVEVRHVVSRVGDNDISIQIGMIVRFLKSCMLEKKIKTNTGAETTKAQLMLLEMVSEECASYSNAMLIDGSDDEDDESEVEEEENNLKKEALAAATVPSMLRQTAQFVLMIVVTIIRACLSVLRPYIPESLVLVPPSSVEEAASLTRVSMKLLEELSCESVPERRKKDVAREIGIIEKSIGRIEKMSSKKSKTQ